MKILGVAGGMGPESTAYFFSLLTSLTCADSDQRHIETVIYSKPGIPDRSAFLCDRGGENPYPAILETCRALEKLTDIIAIPCVTAHHFYEDLQSALTVPVVDMQTLVAETASRFGTVGLLATDGTLASGRLKRMMDATDVNVIVPRSQDGLMEIIYAYKAGRAYDEAIFAAYDDELRSRGAEAIILACTELSLLKRDARLGDYYIDATLLLAKRCVEICTI